LLESPDNANRFAWTMLTLWPLLVVSFYSRMRPTIATCWAIVGGALILPEQIEFDWPTIPAFTKTTAPYYAVLFVLIFKYRNRLRAARPFKGVDRLFLLMLVSTEAGECN
jgi:hypothetical protein